MLFKLTYLEHNIHINQLNNQLNNRHYLYLELVVEHKQVAVVVDVVVVDNIEVVVAVDIAVVAVDIAVVDNYHCYHCYHCCYHCCYYSNYVFHHYYYNLLYYCYCYYYQDDLVEEQQDGCTIRKKGRGDSTISKRVHTALC